MSTRFSQSVEDERAAAGRNGRTCLVRPNLRCERGQGHIHFSCTADHEQDWQPYPIDPYSAIVCDGHTNIHTSELSIHNRFDTSDYECLGLALVFVIIFLSTVPRGCK